MILKYFQISSFCSNDDHRLTLTTYIAISQGSGTNGSLVKFQQFELAYFCTQLISFIMHAKVLKFMSGFLMNKKNYNMILSCYNYGRVTIIYDATVNY